MKKDTVTLIVLLIGAVVVGCNGVPRAGRNPDAAVDHGATVDSDAKDDHDTLALDEGPSPPEAPVIEEVGANPLPPPLPPPCTPSIFVQCREGVLFEIRNFECPSFTARVIGTCPSGDAGVDGSGDASSGDGSDAGDARGGDSGEAGDG